VPFWAGGTDCVTGFPSIFDAAFLYFYFVFIFNEKIEGGTGPRQRIFVFFANSGLNFLNLETGAYVSFSNCGLDKTEPRVPTLLTSFA